MVDDGRIVHIAIASPGDLQAERDAIPGLFTRWSNAHAPTHLEASMWESGAVPSLGGHPQAILNRQIIDRADLLVALFWTKLGTPTPNAPSGTVEEIEEFIKKNGEARVMLYFCTRDVKQKPDDIDGVEFGRIQDFKNEMKARGLYSEFNTKDEFTGNLYQHLDVKVKQLLDGKLPKPSDKSTALSEDAWYDPNNPDTRMCAPIDFGNSLQKIAKNFSKRMKEFDRVDGAGTDKFLELGVHVYRSLARSIEHAIVLKPFEIPHNIEALLQEIILRLETISESRASDKFSEFWEKGRKISDELNVLAKKQKK